MTDTQINTFTQEETPYTCTQPNSPNGILSVVAWSSYVMTTDRQQKSPVLLKSEMTPSLVKWAFCFSYTLLVKIREQPEKVACLKYSRLLIIGWEIDSTC